MSEQTCGITSTTGFPLKLNRNIFDPNWLNTDESQRKKMISPIDFDIQWPAVRQMKINTYVDLNNFRIFGIEDYTNNTTITYAKKTDNIKYTAIPFLSLTKTQHPTLIVQASEATTQEAIMAFTVNTNQKTMNPSVPDIILLCRPIILTNSNTKFTASINGRTLTVSNINGKINKNDYIKFSDDSAITSSLYIKSFKSGIGGNGTYEISTEYLTPQTNKSMEVVTSPFWQAVNISASTIDTDNKTNEGTPQTTSVNLSEIYTYGDENQTLQPMMTYETCIPTKFLGTISNKLGSVLIRVNVVTNPLIIYSPTNTGTGKCNNINNYIFPSAITRIIPNSLGNKLQFASNYAEKGWEFSTGNDNNLQPTPGPPPITTWVDVQKKIEYLIPESLLGKSLADIANTTVVPKTKNNMGRNFKCYTIDPNKDIINNQINIDPITGEDLSETLRRQNEEAAGGDPALAAALAGNAAAQSGIMAGDIELVIFYILSFIGLILWIGYFFHLANKLGDEKGDFFTHLFYFIVITAILITAVIFLAKKK